MSRYDYYDDYNSPYAKYPSKGGAWAWLIFASIIALVDVYFWLPVYRACQANGHDVLGAIKGDIKSFALFAGVFAVYFIFSVIANVKFSRCNKFWGVSFGRILGKIIIFLEYAVYAFSIVAFFIG